MFFVISGGYHANFEKNLRVFGRDKTAPKETVEFTKQLGLKTVAGMLNRIQKAGRP